MGPVPFAGSAQFFPAQRSSQGVPLPQVDGLTGLAIQPQPQVQASDLPPSARDSAESLLSVASGDESEEEQPRKRKPPGLAAAETAVQGDKENAVNGSPAKRLKVIGGVAVRPCALCHNLVVLRSLTSALSRRARTRQVLVSR